jgi:hypothetical protein
MIDVNDEEILRIERGPFAWMRAKQATSMSLEDFRRTAENKFADVGFRAKVTAYTTTQEGVYAFDVEIQGRMAGAGQFDPDQLAHEVQHNLLELPGKHEGAIKTDKGAVRALLSGDRPGPGGHHH